MDSAGQRTGGRFTVRREAALTADRCTVSESLPDGSDSGILAFAEPKRFSLKEEMTFHTDESRTQVSFTVKERSLVGIGDGYDGRDADDDPIGVAPGPDPRLAIAQAVAPDTFQDR